MKKLDRKYFLKNIMHHVIHPTMVQTVIDIPHQGNIYLISVMMHRLANWPGLNTYWVRI